MSTQSTILNFAKNRTAVKTCPCGKDNKDGKFAPYKGYEDKGYCHSCGMTFLPEIEDFDQPKNYQQKKT